MFRTIALAFLVAAFGSPPLLAADRLTVAGQPFCTNVEELKEYVQALVSRDKQWITALKTCGAVKAGVKFTEVERYPGGLPDLNLAKVRLFMSGGRTVVGYTFLTDAQ